MRHNELPLQDYRGKKLFCCSTCDLRFLAEETNRFSRIKKKCIRCLVSEKAALGELTFPECYGRIYDGSVPACTQVCKISEACIIQLVDEKAWHLAESGSAGDKVRNRKMTPQRAAVRLLKALARPIHWRDLHPLIERQTRGSFVSDGTGPKAQRLQTLLRRNKDVVFLGSNYYVWTGIWRPEMGGVVGDKDYGYSKKRTRPIADILEEIKEESLHEELRNTNWSPLRDYDIEKIR